MVKRKEKIQENQEGDRRSARQRRGRIVCPVGSVRPVGRSNSKDRIHRRGEAAPTHESLLPEIQGKTTGANTGTTKAVAEGVVAAAVAVAEVAEDAAARSKAEEEESISLA